MRRPAVLVVAICALIAAAYFLWPSIARRIGNKADSEATSVSRLDELRKARQRFVAGAAAQPIRGRVVAIKGGSGIAGAVVAIAKRHLSRTTPDGQPLVTRTDDRGEFAVAALPPGIYTVSATAPGYRPAVVDRVTIGLGQGRQDDVVIQLAPGDGSANLHGVIQDIGGGPVAGALVRATSFSEGNLYSLFQVPFTALSDDRGEYTLSVGPGQYQLEVAHPDYVPVTRQLDIGAGDHLEDFELTPGGIIFGQVRTRESNAPVAGATVQIKNADHGEGLALLGIGGGTARTDASGAFVLRGLPAGMIALEAFAQGVASREPTEVELGLAEQVTDVVVHVDRAYTVSGFVVDKRAPDQGVGGVMVGAYNMRGEIHVGEDTTSEDGYFAIHGVQNGAYLVGAAAEGYMVNAIGKQVTVANADVTDIVIELDTGVTLAGRVEPPGPARVGLQANPESFAFVNMGTMVSAAMVGARADERGAFVLRGVPRGEFEILAIADSGDEGKLTVKVEGSDQRDLVIRLDTRSSIAGVVRDERGETVGGVRVQASARNAEYMPQFGMLNRQPTDARTRADGSFRISGLRDGEYEMYVSDENGMLTLQNNRKTPPADPKEVPGYFPESVVATISNGQPVTDLELVVQTRNEKITGVVVDEGGKPVADAWVSAYYMGDTSLDDVPSPPPAEGEAASAAPPPDLPPRRHSGQTAYKRALSDEQGRFALADLRAGYYDLEAEGQKGGTRGFANNVRAGETARIALAGLAGITGQVTRAGAPVPEYSLRVSGPNWREQRVRNPEGRFHIKRLDPGTYELTVTAKEGHGKVEVEIKAAGDIQKDIALDAYGSVRGILKAATTGEPMIGMAIMSMSLSNDDDQQAMDMLTGNQRKTDASGAFEVTGLGAGMGDIVFMDPSRPGYNSVGRTSFELKPGENRDLGTIYGHLHLATKLEEQGNLGLSAGVSTAADRPLKETTSAEGVPEGDHLWVYWVEQGGPAERAGIKEGDRIMRIASARMAVVGPQVGQEMLMPSYVPVGVPIEIAVMRDGKELVFTVTPASQPDPTQEEGAAAEGGEGTGEEGAAEPAGP